MFQTFTQPAKTAIESAAKAKTLGAQVSLSPHMLMRMEDSVVEREIVIRELADMMARKMVEDGIVDRSIGTEPAVSPFDPHRIEYRAQVVVVQVDDWRRMMNALAQIARKEATVE
ncbi:MULTISPECIES: hypothetical protein [unclassified Mesorhizobium]|uniref:hypothetical protein n=1 Tax=unclassified Mesorhizobium TaxID=325217 RepID=UPI000FD73340|nr:MULTISPECIES: hypothetical protein [unclassified Mesorhizobium]TGT76181.1 hypothetical protein EN809_000720 [Mesorhizobium sp. M2E.F.Ca.ET.166.01.1.1]TGW02296.1 hypothetical protein EN797_000720 [Mesorhizobium sp. M2E.F.Ca.ET.154.01.1.1]